MTMLNGKIKVVIGGIYMVKVHDNVVPVKIIMKTADGFWYGRSLKTNRKVTIKDVARLRRRISEKAAENWLHPRLY